MAQWGDLAYTGDLLRFLDHIRNEDSPGPPVGSHHACFSDDQEPHPVTDIADLIRDSYEVQKLLAQPRGPFPVLWEYPWEGGTSGECQAVSCLLWT